jgi:hypothetical protein
MQFVSCGGLAVWKGDYADGEIGGCVHSLPRQPCGKLRAAGMRMRTHSRTRAAVRTWRTLPIGRYKKRRKRNRSRTHYVCCGNAACRFAQS